MAPTARVADSYGDNPHEHKPSQDPFLPDVDEEAAEAKQAVSGGADVDDETAEKAADGYPTEEDESWDGSSSSTSETDSESSSESPKKSTGKPARTTASRTATDRTDSSTARSTGTGPAAGKASK